MIYPHDRTLWVIMRGKALQVLMILIQWCVLLGHTNHNIHSCSLQKNSLYSIFSNMKISQPLSLISEVNVLTFWEGRNQQKVFVANEIWWECCACILLQIGCGIFEYLEFRR